MNQYTCTRRLEALKELMVQQDMTDLLVTHPANRFYLSGFELHDSQCNESSGCLLVRTDGPDWLLTDARFTEEARRHWSEEHVHVYGAPRLEKIAGFLKKLGVKQLWVETQAMCAEMYLGLEKELDLYPAPKLVVTDPVKKHYKKMYFVNNRFVGGILIGDISESGLFTDAFQDQYTMERML